MSGPRDSGAGSPSKNTDPIEAQVFTEIGIIAHLIDTLLAGVLPDGLTTAQFGVLNHLLRKGKAETIGQIAFAMQVRQPTMSSTVRKLEDKGLVRLVPDPQDRRVRYVEVTRAGAAERQAALEATAPHLQALFGEMPQARWRALLQPLREVRQVLDAARNPKA